MQTDDTQLVLPQTVPFLQHIELPWHGAGT